MRTNIVIDDQLMQEAMQLSQLDTKKSVVDEALRLFVRMRKQEMLRELRGKVAWDGDLAALRAARHLLNEEGSTDSANAGQPEDDTRGNDVAG